jgi:hypothetical protein
MELLHNLPHKQCDPSLGLAHKLPPAYQWKAEVEVEEDVSRCGKCFRNQISAPIFDMDIIQEQTAENLWRKGKHNQTLVSEDAATERAITAADSSSSAPITFTCKSQI